MFKIESYVTPLILSYVDKFIKNIKPEDSQVSNLLFSLTSLFLKIYMQQFQVSYNYFNVIAPVYP